MGKKQIIENSTDYHEFTKHTYENVRNSDFTLDWDIYPLKYKIYTDCEKIKLPAIEINEFKINTLDALSGLVSGEMVMDSLEKLSALLFYIYGKTGLKQYPNMLFEMRAAPSAGALYPAEIYFATRALNFLDDGLYHYNPGESELSCLRKGDCFNFLKNNCFEKLDDRVNICLILTTIFWRTMWKYRSRSYRYCCEDSGHILGNILPVAEALGFEPSISYFFNDEKVNEFLGVDGINESSMIVVNLKDNINEKKLNEEKYSEEKLPHINFNYKPLSNKELSYPAVQKIKDLTSFDCLPDVMDICSKFNKLSESKKSPVIDNSRSVKLPEPSGYQSSDIAKSIKSRRSSRDYYDRNLSLENISNILYYSTFSPRSEFGMEKVCFNPTFMNIYLIANRIEVIPNGIYRYNKSDNSIIPLKTGDFIEKSTYVSLEQEIVGKSGASFILTANFDHLKILGERGYRMIHLEAGIIGQNIYLAATSLGLGCTGIGAFYDDDFNELLEHKGTDEKVIYELIVGQHVPDERLVDN